MKQLVINQLGDKFGYDTSLKDLEQYVNPMGSIDSQKTQEPLENLIKGALNYDSRVYKEALGINNGSFAEPNGVMKSQQKQQ